MFNKSPVCSTAGIDSVIESVTFIHSNFVFWRIYIIFDKYKAK